MSTTPGISRAIYKIALGSALTYLPNIIGQDSGISFQRCWEIFTGGEKDKGTPLKKNVN
jgi:hypothetical protein